MFTDRYGKELKDTSGSKKITINGKTGTFYWNRQGNVVSYMIDITLDSDNGGTYTFENFLPYNNPLAYATISSYVATTDVHAYGDMRTNGKQLTIYTPSYGNTHTVRGTLTVVVVD
ncbi:hypothetical protein PND93_02615 [Faecalicoccus pleomorphus]|uniref:hypothetical protein n=1 Tax=Faecalicoccus pleomorphus TaxID=1323 RepID=UPI00232D7C3D|nr:hypothetical protein [Faecalicoccus pleomorphus]MDB7990477.1 hypothetical protein [Faecalicoccus pleomorphus]